MALYYYNKYNRYISYYQPYTLTDVAVEAAGLRYPTTVWCNYDAGFSFNSSTGLYASGGSMARGRSAPNIPDAGWYYFPTEGASPTIYLVSDVVVTISGVEYFRAAEQRGSYAVYAKGSLITSGLIAENGTYPDNGASGGYWYVKGAIASWPLNVRVNGVVRGISGKSARIDGVLRNVGTIKVRVNGVLKTT